MRETGKTAKPSRESLLAQFQDAHDTLQRYRRTTMAWSSSTTFEHLQTSCPSTLWYGMYRIHSLRNHFYRCETGARAYVYTWTCKPRLNTVALIAGQLFFHGPSEARLNGGVQSAHASEKRDTETEFLQGTDHERPGIIHAAAEQAQKRLNHRRM